MGAVVKQHVSRDIHSAWIPTESGCIACTQRGELERSARARAREVAEQLEKRFQTDE